MKKSQLRDSKSEMTRFYKHRYARLILIYFDAESLRSGFQFWLGCPGSTDRLCDCVPLYFPPDSVPLGLEKLIPASRRDTLFLLCLPRGGVLSHEQTLQFTEVVARDSGNKNGLVVIFASGHSCQKWRTQWPLPASLEFVAGRYTAHAETRLQVNDDDTHAKRWALQTIETDHTNPQCAVCPERNLGRRPALWHLPKFGQVVPLLD